MAGGSPCTRGIDSCVCQGPHAVTSKGPFYADCHDTQRQVVPNFHRFRTKIYLQNNLITIVKTMIIFYTVTSVNLSYNRIKEVELNAFGRTKPRLEHLSLRHNLLARLNSRVFEKTAKLITLDLSQNQLTSLPARIFVEQREMHELNVSDNKLSSLPDVVFANQPKLTSLDLSHNELSSLPAKVFINQHYLAHLHLDHNRLTSLPEGLFSLTYRITNVTLENNRIREISYSLFPYSRHSASQVTVTLNNNLLTKSAICTLPSYITTRSQDLESHRAGFACDTTVSVTKTSQCAAVNGVVQHVCFCKDKLSIPQKCQGNPCPAGWTPLGKGAYINCVKYTPPTPSSMFTFDEAVIACGNDGGKLARLEHYDKNDRDYLKGILSPTQNARIGFNTLQLGWTIGDTLTESPVIVLNPNSQWHCAVINGVGDVYASNCAARTGYICQRDLQDQCGSSPCQNSGTCIDEFNSFTCKCPQSHVGPTCNIPNTCPKPWTPVADGDHVKCLKYTKTKYNLSEAYTACQRDGGKLARLDRTSKDDRNYLQSILTTTETARIGFRVEMFDRNKWIIGYTYAHPKFHYFLYYVKCVVINRLGGLYSSRCFEKTGYICQKDGWCAYGYTGPLCDIRIERACSDSVHLGFPSEPWERFYYSWYSSDRSVDTIINQCNRGGGTVINDNTLGCAARLLRDNPKFTVPTTSGTLVNLTSRPQGERLRVLFNDGNTKSIRSYGSNPPRINFLCVWKSAPPPVTDGCSRYPCQNGATCTPQSGQKYTCFCAYGFIGRNCDTPILTACKPGVQLGFPAGQNVLTQQAAGIKGLLLCQSQNGNVPDEDTLPCVTTFAKTRSQNYKPPSSGLLVNLKYRSPDSEKLRIMYSDGNTLSIRRYTEVYKKPPRVHVICVWKS